MRGLCALWSFERAQPQRVPFVDESVGRNEPRPISSTANTVNTAHCHILATMSQVIAAYSRIADELLTVAEKT